MFEIKKEYINNTTIQYDFTGNIESKNTEQTESMVLQDMNQTYTFIFNFSHLNTLSVDAVKMLQKFYRMSVEYSFEIIINGLNMQPAMMFEMFQIDKLYRVVASIDQYIHGEINEFVYSA
jgi:anti-anti-sigma regulatory factor